jgi:hypothetical protein
MVDVIVGRHCPYDVFFSVSGKPIPIRCKSWYCPSCAVRNSRKHAIRVKWHANHTEKPLWFWTLTMRSKYKYSHDAFPVLKRLWDTFRKAIQRDDPSEWNYCAFIEGQPRRRQMPHFHIISDRKAYRRLKDLAMYSGFGYQAEEKPVSTKKAAEYVTKYATKSDSKFPKNFRRVRYSRGFLKVPKKDFEVLIPRHKKESLGDYVIRVSNETGISPDDLYDRYSNFYKTLVK